MDLNQSMAFGQFIISFNFRVSRSNMIVHTHLINEKLQVYVIQMLLSIIINKFQVYNFHTQTTFVICSPCVDFSLTLKDGKNQGTLNTLGSTLFCFWKSKQIICLLEGWIRQKTGSKCKQMYFIPETTQLILRAKHKQQIVFYLYFYVPW